MLSTGFTLSTTLALLRARRSPDRYFWCQSSLLRHAPVVPRAERQARQASVCRVRRVWLVELLLGPRAALGIVIIDIVIVIVVAIVIVVVDIDVLAGSAAAATMFIATAEAGEVTPLALEGLRRQRRPFLRLTGEAERGGEKIGVEAFAGVKEAAKVVIELAAQACRRRDGLRRDNEGGVYGEMQRSEGRVS